MDGEWKGRCTAGVKSPKAIQKPGCPEVSGHPPRSPRPGAGRGAPSTSLSKKQRDRGWASHEFEVLEAAMTSKPSAQQFEYSTDQYRIHG